MSQEIVSVLAGIIYGTIGALLGGAAVLVVYSRTVKAILASPVLVTALEKLAASWPAPVRDAVHETGELLVTATDDPNQPKIKP